MVFIYDRLVEQSRALRHGQHFFSGALGVDISFSRGKLLLQHDNGFIRPPIPRLFGLISLRGVLASMK